MQRVYQTKTNCDKPLEGLLGLTHVPRGPRISGLQRQIRDPSEAELWISRGNALLQVTQQWYPGMRLD